MKRRHFLWLALATLCTLSACNRCGTPQDTTPTPAPQPETKAYTRPSVIDAHTHLGANAYDVALEIMEKQGVARVVNLSGGHQGRGLEPHLKAMEAHPGRIAVFYNLAWRVYPRPDFGQIMAEGLEEAVLRGYAGLKISKALGLGVQDAQGNYVPVDDPKLAPIWDKAGQLGIPVSMHTGDPKAFFEPIDANNERIEELSAAPHWSFADPKYPRREVLLAQRDRMLARHRKTTFILVHFGNNPEDLDYAESLLERHPNVVLDISARLAEIGRHDPEKVRALFIKYKDRILFGTDLGIHKRARPKPGEGELSLFLGSLSKEPPTPKDIGPFYDLHWQFLEADAKKTGLISHPVPIQGPWKIKPIALPEDVLQAVYHDNAYRLIFAPMFERRGIKDPLLSSGPPRDP